MRGTQEPMAALGTFPAALQSPGSLPSAAPVHLHEMPAPLAPDGAAPAALAAAALHHLRPGREEAPAAAQQLAAVRSQRCPVALAAGGAEDPVPRVPVAEVRAGQQVDQVVSRVGLEARALGHQELAGTDPLRVNLRCPLKLFLEDAAHLAERRHDLPAGAHLAGARHTMALALHLHMGQESLWSRRQLPARPGTPLPTSPMLLLFPQHCTHGAGGKGKNREREEKRERERAKVSF